eukprot:5431140-Pyramimonas_sp.AAC.1
MAYGAFHPPRSRAPSSGPLLWRQDGEVTVARDWRQAEMRELQGMAQAPGKTFQNILLVPDAMRIIMTIAVNVHGVIVKAQNMGDTLSWNCCEDVNARGPGPEMLETGEDCNDTKHPGTLDRTMRRTGAC